MPVKKEILYPIFLECIAYVKNTFWENLFEELAYGKCPYGTFISKNFLCCSYKKKEFSYKIERKDPQIIYNEIYSILTTKLGLISHEEKMKQKKDFLETEDTLKNNDKIWSDIKKKNTKELLIELYVVRMKQKYSLSIKQSRYLLSIILISLVFKVILPSDINFYNGKIISINGIEFDTKQVKINHDLYNLETTLPSNISNDKKMMTDNWKTFFQKLNKE